MKLLLGLFTASVLILTVLCESTAPNNVSTTLVSTETTAFFYETTEMPEKKSGCDVPHGNWTLQCDYVAENTDACEGGGYIQYNEWVHCSTVLPLVIIICIILMIEFFIGLSVAADSYLCPSIAVIVEHLKINENIAGVTIMALGNGAPDIFSSVAAVLGSDTPKADLSLGALLGSGIFLNTVIVGTVCVTHPFTVMRRPTVRDFAFYIFALIWAAISMFDGAIKLWNAIGFLVIYFLYVFVVIFGRYMNNKIMARKYGDEEEPGTPDMDRKSMETDVTLDDIDANLADVIDSPSRIRISIEETESVPSDPDPNENFTPIPLDVEELTNEEGHRVTDEKRLSVYQIAKQSSMRSRSSTVRSRRRLKRQANSLDFEADWAWDPFSANNEINAVPDILQEDPVEDINLMIGGVFPLALIFLVLGLIGAVAVYFTTTRATIPRFHTALSYIGFVVAVLWIYAFAREIVGILTMIAAYTHIPHSILGLTLLAWSNSLGDLICDLTVAKQGYPQMAVSACYGGALFNLVVSIGLSFTIANLKNGTVSHFDFNISLRLLLIFLLFVFITSFIRFVITKFHASRLYGIFLLCTYVAFMVCVVLARIGLLHFLRFGD